MAWTYDPTKLSSDPLMQVRFKIGDTISEDPLMQDEEITSLLTENSNNIIAVAIACCEHLRNRYARQADYTVGREMKVSASQRAEMFDKILNQLQKENIPLGGIEYTDPKRQVFDVGIMDNPYSRPEDLYVEQLDGNLET